MKHQRNLIIVLLIALVAIFLCSPTPASSEVQHDTTEIKSEHQEVEELKTENELLQKRSRFTTGGVVMVLGIVALLAFLAFNSRWTRRLEIKNRQLQRERNVVVAQNKQLEVERDRAEAASKAKTAFIQSMTHEIRTPLNSISGFTQILNMTDAKLSEEERIDCCLRIMDNTRMLTNILDDLILISDMESGAELPPAEQSLVNGIVGQATEAVRPHIAETVHLVTQSKMPDEEMVKTYPEMIHTILTKLLDNAAKFTQQGSITLSLSREDDMLHFSVTDTGPGIPAD